MRDKQENKEEEEEEEGDDSDKNQTTLFQVKISPLMWQTQQL